jgi:hypothetical protein
VKGVFQIKMIAPNYETPAVDFGVKHDGSLVFTDLHKKNMNQSRPGFVLNS